MVNIFMKWLKSLTFHNKFTKACAICDNFENDFSYMEEEIFKKKNKWMASLQNKEIHISTHLNELNEQLALKKLKLSKLKLLVGSISQSLIAVKNNIITTSIQNCSWDKNTISLQCTQLLNEISSSTPYFSTNTNLDFTFLQNNLLKDITFYTQNITTYSKHLVHNNHNISRKCFINFTKIKTSFQTIVDQLKSLKIKFECIILLIEANESLDNDFKNIRKVHNNLQKTIFKLQLCYDYEIKTLTILNKKRLVDNYDLIQKKISKKLKNISNISNLFAIVSKKCQKFQKSHEGNMKSLKENYDSHNTNFHHMNEVLLLLNEYQTHLKSYQLGYKYTPNKMITIREVTVFTNRCTLNMSKILNTLRLPNNKVIDQLHCALKENNVMKVDLTEEKSLLENKWLIFTDTVKLFEKLEIYSDELAICHNLNFSNDYIDEMTNRFHEIQHSMLLLSDQLAQEFSVTKRLVDLLEVECLLNSKIKQTAYLFNASLKELNDTMKEHYCNIILNILQVYTNSINSTMICMNILNDTELKYKMFENFENVSQNMSSKLEIFLNLYFKHDIKSMNQKFNLLENAMYNIRDNCSSLELNLNCLIEDNCAHLKNISMENVSLHENLNKLQTEFKLNEQKLDLYEIIISDIKHNYDICHSSIEECDIHLKLNEYYEDDVKEIIQDSTQIIKRLQLIIYDVERDINEHIDYDHNDILQEQILKSKSMLSNAENMKKQCKDVMDMFNHKIRQINNIRTLILTYHHQISTLIAYLNKSHVATMHSKKELDLVRTKLEQTVHSVTKHNEVIIELKSNLEIINKNIILDVNQIVHFDADDADTTDAHATIDCTMISQNAQSTSNNGSPNSAIRNENNDNSNDSLNVTFNEENSTCPICFDDLKPHDAIILSYCGHTICKQCLESHVKLYESEELQCPCVDGMIKCPGLIYERELRASVSEETYNNHIKRVIKVHEAQTVNSFHCQTPGCDYWVIIEDTIVDSMLCPLCRIINCLNCRAVHRSMTCLEFKAHQSNDENLKKTEMEIESKLEEGIVMKCPNCGVIIEKVDGCDGLYCPQCNLQLCWATKGPRWGKKGRGDISGGCRCGVEGLLCHPLCNFCH